MRRENTQTRQEIRAGAVEIQFLGWRTHYLLARFGRLHRERVPQVFNPLFR